MSFGIIQLDGRQPTRRHCLCRYAQTWGLWWLNEEDVSSETRIGKETQLGEFGIVQESLSLLDRVQVKDTEPSKTSLYLY